jgi:GR25 family glycosyltransferase involved in LPS biosynthesis
MMMLTRTTTNAAINSTRLAIAGLFCFAISQVFFSSTETERSLLLYEEHNPHSSSGPSPLQAEPEERGHNESTSFILESFAISFDPNKVETLRERNQHANLGPVLWVNGADGMHQRTLDLWAQLTNRKHSPMTVEVASKLHKDHYNSPHAVGCYMAHWNLLRTLAHRPIELLRQQQHNKTKHAYLILEDDAACAPGLNKEIECTIEQLPSDWDILFVGGKPFSYFDPKNNNDNKTYPTKHGEQLIRDCLQQEMSQNWTATTIIHQLIRKAVCQGDFGKARGPLAPDGSRSLSQDTQPYWRSNYLTNTHSYVVNPHRVAHVAHLLKPSLDVPVDIRLGDLMASSQLNAYMTTRSWCEQMSHEPLLEPQSWKGFFAFDGKYIWQTQIHLDDENCAF